MSADESGIRVGQRFEGTTVAEAVLVDSDPLEVNATAMPTQRERTNRSLSDYEAADGGTDE